MCVCVFLHFTPSHSPLLSDGPLARFRRSIINCYSIFFVALRNAYFVAGMFVSAQIHFFSLLVHLDIYQRHFHIIPQIALNLMISNTSGIWTLVRCIFALSTHRKFILKIANFKFFSPNVLKGEREEREREKEIERKRERRRRRDEERVKLSV